MEFRDNGIQIRALTERDLIPGNFDITDDFSLINHLLLLGKFCLYYSRCQKRVVLNLSCVIARTRRVYIFELYIVGDDSKLLQHHEKCENFSH